MQACGRCGGRLCSYCTVWGSPPPIISAEDTWRLLSQLRQLKGANLGWPTSGGLRAKGESGDPKEEQRRVGVCMCTRARAGSG